ncbi:MAG TPA: hypothetical protein VF804_00940 [Holophagaceae bacterium]
MRTLLRTLLACALLIGGMGLDWAPAASAAESHETCCCGMLPGPHDTCPCPKPEGPQGPSQNGCGTRTTPVSTPLALLQRAGQAETRRSEPRPEPVAGSEAQVAGIADVQAVLPARGRDPDLGRHLARLSLLRI